MQYLEFIKNVVKSWMRFTLKATLKNFAAQRTPLVRRNGNYSIGKFFSSTTSKMAQQQQIVPSSSTEDGNTNQSSVSKKQVSPAKHWCFTFNNYGKDDIKMILEILVPIVPRFVFQEEIGEKGEKEGNEGTPHLQGYLMFAKKDRPFPGLGLSKKIHWEVCRNVDAAIKYCQKEKTRVGKTYYRGIEKPYTVDIKEWQPFMKLARDIILSEPDPRKIHWFWEGKGCIGKTLFCKWAYMNMDRCIMLSNKAADMKDAIVRYQKNTGTLPRTILINIPRTNLKYVSFAGLEEVKDMFFFSGKYEGGMVCGRSPHILIFANSAPNLYSDDIIPKLRISEDRVIVHRIIVDRKESPVERGLRPPSPPAGGEA